ncbi:hypothetical protein WN943_020266 [Citrus x changshan-huyou]
METFKSLHRHQFVREGQPTGFVYALDYYLAVRVQNTYDGFGHNISIGGQEVDGS